MPVERDRHMLRGGAWLLEASEPTRCSRRTLTDEQRLISADHAASSSSNEVLPALDGSNRRTGASRDSCSAAAASSACSAWTCRKSTAACSSTRSTSLHRQRADGARRRRSAPRSARRRTSRCCRCSLFGTEAQKRKYLPEAADGRAGRRLLPQRDRLGLRRARRQGARHRAGRRQLRAERREDVDHQRRLRRRLHRLRESRERRARSPPSSSSARSAASRAARKSTRWACTGRRRPP